MLGVPYSEKSHILYVNQKACLLLGVRRNVLRKQLVLRQNFMIVSEICGGNTWYQGSEEMVQRNLMNRLTGDARSRKRISSSESQMET